MATTMTEIPIKDLALTTSPAGKQLLVRDASAGLQRIDYDQIAKNLVESYGASSLAGKNQSIKAAIDSLNSGLTQCNTNITTINNSLSKFQKCNLIITVTGSNFAALNNTNNGYPFYLIVLYTENANIEQFFPGSFIGSFTPSTGTSFVGGGYYRNSGMQARMQMHSGGFQVTECISNHTDILSKCTLKVYGIG